VDHQHLATASRPTRNQAITAITLRSEQLAVGHWCGAEGLRTARDLNQDLLARHRNMLGESQFDAMGSCKGLLWELHALGDLQAARELDSGHCIAGTDRAHTTLARLTCYYPACRHSPQACCGERVISSYNAQLDGREISIYDQS
jgi:hypothetical protein